MFDFTTVDEFMRAEGHQAAWLPTHLRMAGIGTVAHRLLNSDGFRSAMAGVDFEVVPAHASAQALVDDVVWDMALVFSPEKAAAAALLAKLTPTAAATATVDTLVRSGTTIIGFNTTAWAVQIVLEAFCGGSAPDSVLVLGAGASARSVVVAVGRVLPRARVVVASRNPAEVSAFPGASIYSPEAAAAVRPDLVINCTTWGETPESEQAPFGLPFSDVLAPGIRFLDLNNRPSGLQTEALSAGAQVMSGVAVRIANNACRRALAMAGKETK